MNNILFLCSGGGGNMKFIFECQKHYKLPFNIVGLIADRECGAIQFARSKGIKNHLIDYVKCSDEEIINYIDQFQPNLIVTNIHRIISKKVLQKYGNKFINIHYSYLPAYAGSIGMKAVDLAMLRKSKFIGVTSHFLTEEVDQGEIIAQGIVPTYEKDIHKKVFECGSIVLLSTIFYILKFPMKPISYCQKMLFSPFPENYIDEKINYIFKFIL